MNTDEKSLAVRQANDLIEASYKIASIGEGRLVRMLIAQIQAGDEDFKTYRISVADFAKFFGLNGSGGSVYELIDKAAESLAHRPITIRSGRGWLHTNWLSSAEYKRGDGFVELCFDRKLKPYLLQLKGHFTQYDLERIVNFRSSYSMRLFELLKAEQFKAGVAGNFSRTFIYEELRAKMAVESAEYTFFKDFRVNVIEPAVREINANPDINICKVDYQKTGRKISHVVFYCERAKQSQLDLDGPPPRLEEVQKESPDYIKELVFMGIDEATAWKWKKKYGVRNLIRNTAYTKAMQKSGKIRDSVTGFLARAVADNLGGGWEEEEKQRLAAQAEKEKAEHKKQAEEAKEAQAQKERRAEVESRFYALSEDEQEAHRAAYVSQAPDFMRGHWMQAKEKKGAKPEQSPLVGAAFFSFYNSQDR